MNQPSTILKTVEDIAREAGQVLNDYYGRIRHIEHKGIGDVVTEADKASEKLISDRLKSHFPSHAQLGEEFGLSHGEPDASGKVALSNNKVLRASDTPEDSLPSQSDYCWVTDPLDGTANYAMHFPIFSVAIALLYQGNPILGVVFDPIADRMFSATKERDSGFGVRDLVEERGSSTNGSATLNGMPLRVNDRVKLDADGLFGFSAEVIESRHPFMQKSAKGRSLGSAALHICSVAAGYFDGSLDFSTKLWDIAAATVILEEAGGIITHPDGSPLFPLASDASAYQGAVVPFLASNGKLHAECLQYIAGRT